MRIRRRPFAWLVLFALLFAQLATTAYACERAIAAIADPIEASYAAPGAGPCESMQMSAPGDETPGPLCIDHCGHGAQASADVHSPVLQWGPIELIALVRTVPPGVTAHAWPRDAGEPGLRTTVAPPIAILLGRFLS